MSVAEIKAQADALSFEELSDLARHLRALALRKDPVRREQVRAGMQSREWLDRAEFEKALTDLEHNGQ